MTKIPLFKVAVNKEQFLRNAANSIDAGVIAQGPIVDNFEQALAGMWGVDPELVVTVNSGTSAIQLAMAVLDIGQGDDVVLPPVTCSADPHAVQSMGARVVWCDVDPESGLVDSASASLVVTKRTKAFLLTDWGGSAPYVKSLQQARPEIPIIEDAAHRLTGPFYGDIVCFSFQAIKHLTTGDGGCVLFRDKKLADRARLQRWFSIDRRSSADFRCRQTSDYQGFKMHLNDIAAGMGLANLELAQKNIEISRDNARYYQKRFPARITCPWQEDSPYWIYTLLVKNREKVIEDLARAGIQTSPVHSLCSKNKIFPNTWLAGAAMFSDRNLAIPSGFWVTPEDREKVVNFVAMVT